MLSDALQLAEIPSPTRKEELRAAFVLERLGSLGLSSHVDEQGNIVARLRSPDTSDGPPLLLFTHLGSSRWHSLESLSSVDSAFAAGAGLADVLGDVSLLSLSEGIVSGRISTGRDILLLFLAHSLGDPEGDVFKILTDDPVYRPCAALGLRGFTLGRLVDTREGAYRIRVRVEQGNEEAAWDAPDQVVDTVIAIAKNLSGITWDSERTTHCHIRRVETGAGFGRFPAEGLIELELESSDATFLEMAMKTATATANFAQSNQGVKVTVEIVSFVPVGNKEVDSALSKVVLNHMRDQHIKTSEYTGSDPSAYLSVEGIPALSIGLALGRTGLRRDRVEIDSIEKGRLFLESLVESLSRDFSGFSGEGGGA
jgi:di/tripeptidase